MIDNHELTRIIRVAIAGIGNCAGSFIEGLYYYRHAPANSSVGLLFPSIGGYTPCEVEVVIGFDISARKVGRPLHEAIYATPNNFTRNGLELPISSAMVYRGPSLDGNPPHLAKFVPESERQIDDVASLLLRHEVDVVLCLLPTGSHEAATYYARAAVKAQCAFINCIPSILAQDEQWRSLYEEHDLPLLGDDIKSQVGTTILHRTLLHMLEVRGAKLVQTSQINIGGNMDFANFVHRAESKLISKRKSLQRYVGNGCSHVGHHYDPTRGPLKTALIEIEAQVFGGSPVKIEIRLESDDKPNSSGSIVDLVRIAKIALDRKIGGCIPEVAAFYMKSPPMPMDDLAALQLVKEKWIGESSTIPEEATPPITDS